MSQDKKLYPVLSLLLQDIKKYKVAIATSWVKKDTVKVVFEQRKISLKQFRDSYGVPIIEYFISVIDETKPLGDCPVMSKLVKYLLAKNISPKEVFDICMGFRFVLVGFLLQKKSVVNNATFFMNEIATIMDANLSGVLEIFTTANKKSQEKLQSLETEKERLIKEKEELVEGVSYDELTGFINYGAFEKVLIENIATSLEDKQRLFLAIVDIPNLRSVNLSKGREAGDAIIISLAEDLKALEQENIYMARLEGDRYGVLLKYEQEQKAYDWCVNLYKSFSDKEEKKVFSVTEIDTAESLTKLFIRAYDLVDEVNSTEDMIINTDFTKIEHFVELSDQNEFISEFEKVKLLETSVYYKELPMNHKSDIVRIHNNQLVISASQKQVKISEVGKFVYFPHENLGNVKANIQSLNENNSEITLDSFRIDIHSPLDRKLYRVQASSDFRGFIRDNNRDYDIEILDLNNKFVALKIDRKRNFDIGSSFTLEIRMIINNEAKNFTTQSTVVRLEKVLGGYKIVVSCTPNEDNEEMLQDYISSFQRNIIQDFSED